MFPFRRYYGLRRCLCLTTFVARVSATTRLTAGSRAQAWAATRGCTVSRLRAAYTFPPRRLPCHAPPPASPPQPTTLPLPPHRTTDVSDGEGRAGGGRWLWCAGRDQDVVLFILPRARRVRLPLCFRLSCMLLVVYTVVPLLRRWFSNVLYSLWPSNAADDLHWRGKHIQR